MPIKIGSRTVAPKGIRVAYVGDKPVFLGLPSAYRRLTGIVFDAKTWYRLSGVHLFGSDTLRISASIARSCNVIGSYTSASAQTNYSLYLSTSSSAKYLRYNGGTYDSHIASSNINKRFNIVITPTGSYGLPTNDTWTEKEFESVSDLCIGLTGVSVTSTKMDGTIFEDIVVDGRIRLIPCERVSDNEVGYYEAYTGIFYEPTGDTPTPLGYA